MKRFLPELCGLVAGILLGVFLLAEADIVPPFFWNKVINASRLVYGLLEPKGDLLNSSVLFTPMCILFCALPGALLGLAVGSVLRARRGREKLTPGTNGGEGKP